MMKNEARYRIKNAKPRRVRGNAWYSNYLTESGAAARLKRLLDDEMKTLCVYAVKPNRPIPAATQRAIEVAALKLLIAERIGAEGAGDADGK
jgi:hypothetical protein